VCNFLNQVAYESYDAQNGKGIKINTPTKEQYSALESAYAYFNKKLFKRELTPVLITLSRRSRSKGYYLPKSWFNDSCPDVAQININPVIFHADPKTSFSTLVHEMAHHQLFLKEKTAHGGYHTHKFAELMEEIGLACSHTGKPGGRQVGRHMSHYIIPGGAFEKAFDAMPKEYYAPFKPHDTELVLKNANKNKTTYCCPQCKFLAWAKPDANLLCGSCSMQMAAL